MTQEEKAKAYDEALERARKMLNMILDNELLGFPDQIREIFPQLCESESEDERIRKALLEYFGKECDTATYNGIYCYEIYAWLEKQKEQKHYWKPTETDVALFNKAVTTNKALTPTERAQLDIIRSKFGHCHAVNCSGMAQKEQKPNIELIQRSWYMEGYHDREFGKEPKWIIKTGEGGPKHELNPRYGQPLTEQRPTEEQLHNLNEAIKSYRMDGFDKIADSLHSLYNILNTQEQKPVDLSDMMVHKEPYIAPVPTPMVADEQKSTSISCGHENDAEWGQEDKEKIVTISEIIEHCTTIPYSGGTLTLNKEYKKELLCFIRTLRPSWKPSEEQIHAIIEALKYLPNNKDEWMVLNTLVDVFKKLI